MKVSILTLHNVCNYGTQLQAYATQEKMRQYFDEVSFLDFRRKDTYGIDLLKTFTKGNAIKSIFILPTLFYWKIIFGGFRKKYLNISKKKYLDSESFQNFDDYADLYFTGSDQVWNSGWNNGVIPEYYLSFLPENKKRYAYASSFGKDKIEMSEIEETQKYITKFSLISVREESAVRILKENYKFDNVRRIVDPTLAMTGEFWRNIAPKLEKKEEYILIYNLNRNKEFDDYAIELSKKTGLKLYRFCTRLDQVIRPGKSLVMPKIFEFISWIDNAKYILTDSFHATAFSINLGKEPICWYPDKYSARLSEFLKLIHCEQRRVRGIEDFDVINRKIDFVIVNKILEKERKNVDAFLKEIVKKEEICNEK